LNFISNILKTIDNFLENGVIHAFINLKTWWNRGLTYIAIPLTMFNLLSLSLLWRPILVTYGIPSWLFYVVVPTITVVVTLYDTIKEVWKREAIIQNDASNPWYAEFTKMFQEVSDIKIMLEEEQSKTQKLKMEKERC
jgi:hypothetical protein